MGVNWNEGVMRWIPYVDANGRAYPLNHLHPFQYDLVFGEDVRVRIRVAFAMHCFTRHCADDDDPSRYYKDHREIRTFCPDRYALSPRLPVIARELTTRKCGFAKEENYVTTDVPVSEGLTAL
jgi:hypothetical protein